MIEVAYTPSGTPLKLASVTRDYVRVPSWSAGEYLVKVLIKDGCYNIFIDKYDRVGDLIDFKGFNQLT